MRKLLENGMPTSRWPGVVKLLTGGGICTAQIVHARVLLTAGHCVGSAKTSQACGKTLQQCVGTVGTEIPSNCLKDPKTLRVQVGNAEIRATNVTSIDRWACGQGCGNTLPPGSRGGKCYSLGSDIALVLLESPITDVQPLPVTNHTAVVGDSACAVGYGRTRSGNSGVKRHGHMHVDAVVGNIILAGDPAQMCQGDSGGAIFVRQAAGWAIAGVTHAGDGDGICSLDSGYYTSMAAHWDWAQQTLFSWTSTRLVDGGFVEDCGLAFSSTSSMPTNVAASTLPNKSNFLQPVGGTTASANPCIASSVSALVSLVLVLQTFMQCHV